ncbi:hypothetical protein JCM8547_004516 [Rhodosporidiobolus lusitaniae]
MAPASLAELQGLKYAALRTLCKENGLKASGKTEQLFAQLAGHYGFTAEESESEEESNAPPAKPVEANATKPRKTVDTTQLQEEEALETPVKENIVYMTSPNTKSTVATFAVTVKELQAQLATASTSLTDLQKRSPALSKADIIALVNSKLTEHRTSMAAELDKRFGAVSSGFARLEQATAAQKLQFEQNLRTFRSEVDLTIETLRTDLTSRLDSLGKSKEKELEPTLLAIPAEPAPTPRRKVSFGDLDAPPTRSVSFPSPGSPALASTPRRSSLVNTAVRKATPFKPAAPVSVSASTATPASALPFHMLATAASAAKRSPRSSKIASPAPALEPQSPAGSPPKAAIGKRARESEASELSMEVAALDSPAAEARSRSTSGGSNSSVVSPGRRLSEILAGVSASAKKEKEGNEQHARKRQRVSTASAPEPVEQEESEEGDDEDFQDSFEGESSFDQEEGEEEDEEVFVRDYLVAVKTGDEQPTALKSKPRSSAPPTSTVAVNDPSFFAGVASSTTSRRVILDPASSSTSSSTKENTAPPLSRKSLPMASLPVAFVSPYASKISTTSIPPKSPAPAPSTSTSSFSLGTPSSNAFNRRITIGPAASARKATPARLNPYSSAKKAAPATAGPLSRRSSANSSVGTPQAARTLFGSERFGKGSSEGEGEGEGEGSRFGDDVGEEGFVSALTSPQKGAAGVVGGWGLFGAAR